MSHTLRKNARTDRDSLMTRRAVLAAAAVVLAAAGCGKGGQVDGRPTVVPVSGKVLRNGQPVDGARVTFFNPQANTTAYGTTGPDGVFTLSTFGDKDGGAPGTNRVAVRKVEMISKAKEGFDYGASSEVPPEPEERWHTPKRYGKADTSGLTADVTESGPNDFTFELKD